MKADDEKIMLSIKYSFLDPTNDKTIQQTETEHFFVASNKKKVLAKINAFETSLKSDKATSLYQRVKAYLKHFIASWRYTQSNMMRI